MAHSWCCFVWDGESSSGSTRIQNKENLTNDVLRTIVQWVWRGVDRPTQSYAQFEVCKSHLHGIPPICIKSTKQCAAPTQSYAHKASKSSASSVAANIRVSASASAMVINTEIIITAH